jgi:hypothetical protein
MRHHDLRMVLAAIVAFGPVVFAAAYGVANASRLQAAGAATVASAPAEERAMIIAPQPEHKISPMVSSVPLGPQAFISVSLDRPRSKHQKTQLAQ